MIRETPEVRSDKRRRKSFLERETEETEETEETGDTGETEHHGTS